MEILLRGYSAVIAPCGSTVCALMWIQMIIFAASFVLSYITSCICIATYLDYFVQMVVHIIVTYNHVATIYICIPATKL